jgi:hypothetical protein
MVNSQIAYSDGLNLNFLNGLFNYFMVNWLYIFAISSGIQRSQEIYLDKSLHYTAFQSKT